MCFWLVGYTSTQQFCFQRQGIGTVRLVALSDVLSTLQPCTSLIIIYIKMGHVVNSSRHLMVNQEHKHLMLNFFLNLASYQWLVLLLPKSVDINITTYLRIMVLVHTVSLLILKCRSWPQEKCKGLKKKKPNHKLYFLTVCSCLVGPSASWVAFAISQPK